MTETVITDIQTATGAPVPANHPLTIKSLMNRDDVKTKFREMLGDRAPGFITSILQIATNNDLLAKANPMSIYNAAATAATMDLPINNNLGFAWIVPYDGQAQFQMGYKGFIQLAMRSGQYNRLNVVLVYENQFRGWNSLTEELDADFSLEGDGQVVGYCSYFRLINGFEKTVYWTRQKVHNHGLKYSKSFNHPKGQWKNNFDDMALKTVLKSALSKWGILSIEMRIAIKADQAVIFDDQVENVVYPDNETDSGETPAEKGDAATQAALDALKGVQDKANQATGRGGGSRKAGDKVEPK